MKIKKVPLRKCLACNEMKEKKELLRVVKNKDNEISIDNTGKLNGRGAYICNNDICVNDVIKNNKLSRVFKMPVSEDVYKSLLDTVEDK